MKYIKITKIPSFIYGNGKGLESTKRLEYWNKEEDWTTEDEEDNEEDIEEIEVEDDEDLLEMFILENSKDKGNGNFSCVICDKGKGKETFNKKKLKQHFVERHKREFEEYFGDDSNFD
jgi:hypothetical protein